MVGESDSHFTLTKTVSFCHNARHQHRRIQAMSKLLEDYKESAKLAVFISFVD